jgi:hypothetical protein
MFSDSQWTVSINNQIENLAEYQSHSLHEKGYSFFPQFQGEKSK